MVAGIRLVASGRDRTRGIKFLDHSGELPCEKRVDTEIFAFFGKISLPMLYMMTDG